LKKDPLFKNFKMALEDTRNPDSKGKYKKYFFPFTLFRPLFPYRKRFRARVAVNSLAIGFWLLAKAGI
jgi:hypothetical protein